MDHTEQCIQMLRGNVFSLYTKLFSKPLPAHLQPG